MASKFTFLNEWLMILIAHLTATIVVFAASRFYKNSSLYDPFWSVAPAPIVFYLAFWPESQENQFRKDCSNHCSNFILVFQTDY